MYNAWDDALAKIQQQISPSSFNTWFSDTSILSNEDGVITIGVKNTFYIKQLRDKYYTIIADALKKSNIDVKEIKFEVKSANKPKVKPHEVTPTIRNNDIQNISSITHAAKKSYNIEGNGLSDKFTFETFVAGKYNEIAYGAAKNIIDHPGKSINPFFLYGGPGLGKTHLVQAIGNAIQKNNPTFKIKYIPINHFYSELIDSIRRNKGAEFYNKYTQLDCLIVDDFPSFF